MGNLNDWLIILIRIIDVGILWFEIYKLLKYARGTQIMNLLKGVGVFLVVKFMSSFIGLQSIDWLLGQILNFGVVAMIILFQPELRKALEALGRNAFKNRGSSQTASARMIEDIEYALHYMAKRRIGALISIEGQDSLQDFIDTGIKLDSTISRQLLINIFIPNTPLHDGAVIIRNYRIESASCYLPLSESPLISKELGTRHRAAIGLSEVTDALTLIVSEETGAISLSKHDRLYRDVDEKELHDLLEENLRLIGEDEGSEKNSNSKKYINDMISAMFNQRGDNK